MKEFRRDDLAFQQFDHLTMGQCRDGVQTFEPLDLVNDRFGNHPTVADKDNFFQSVLALQLRDLLWHRGGVLSVTGKNFDSDRTTLRAAQQSDHHLFVTPLAIAIVAKGDDVALGVGSFKVAAGNVVEHQVTILEMTSRQSALNGALAFQEPVHRQANIQTTPPFAFTPDQTPPTD